MTSDLGVQGYAVTITSAGWGWVEARPEGGGGVIKSPP